jgi:C4-dicarboxylate transporter DctQ subunit
MGRQIVRRLEEGIISLLLVAMTLIVFLEVVLRFGFNTGFLWAQELTLHVSAWLVLFGASYGVKVGAHIGVDAVVRLLKPEVRRIVTMFAVVLCLAYCGLLGYGAWVYLSKMYRLEIELEDMAIERWIAHSILLIGFVLLAVRLIEMMVALWRRRVFEFAMPNEALEALRTIGREAPHKSGGEER